MKRTIASNGVSVHLRNKSMHPCRKTSCSVHGSRASSKNVLEKSTMAMPFDARIMRRKTNVSQFVTLQVGSVGLFCVRNSYPLGSAFVINYGA